MCVCACVGCRRRWSSAGARALAQRGPPTHSHKHCLGPDRARRGGRVAHNLPDRRALLAAHDARDAVVPVAAAARAPRVDDHHRLRLPSVRLGVVGVGLFVSGLCCVRCVRRQHALNPPKPHNQTGATFSAGASARRRARSPALTLPSGPTTGARCGGAAATCSPGRSRRARAAACTRTTGTRRPASFCAGEGVVWVFGVWRVWCVVCARRSQTINHTHTHTQTPSPTPPPPTHKKRYVYERLTPPGRRPTFMTLLTTQLVSGLWHGLYPGYILFFAASALFFAQSTVVYKWEQVCGVVLCACSLLANPSAFAFTSRPTRHTPGSANVEVTRSAPTLQTQPTASRNRRARRRY